jgi:twitching motility protein PilT
MSQDILWLVGLGISQGLFTRAQCTKIRGELGDGADLMTFAQKLIDDGVVHDVEALESLAGVAMQRAESGPPPVDPFSEATLAPAAAAAQPAVAAAPAAAPAAGPIDFPFDRIASMEDAALADAFRALLRATVASGASDLHLCAGAKPFIRRNRMLSMISDRVLTAEDSQRLNTVLLAEGHRRIFQERKDLDYALSLDSNSRFRVNLMVHKQGPAGAYRMVPAETKTLAGLGFARHVDTIKKLLSYHNGLILVTGPVGAGKTTTLASMVAYLNETRSDHIITVEDPIEVVQPAKGCNVTQREVGSHTKTFFSALKGALREDPDVIVIGELRDLETIEMAISASETGHLVIGTMHTSDAATTLNRLLDVFPPAQQAQIRASVAESLRGVICQRLLPAATGGGVVVACEILVSNLAIQALIRDNKTSGLRNTMETGSRDGMCLMDNVVFSLWQEKQISADTARANINNRVLKQKIS